MKQTRKLFFLKAAGGAAGLLSMGFFILLLNSHVPAQFNSSSSMADLKDELGNWQEKIKDIKKQIRKQEEETRQSKLAFGKYQKRDARYRSGLAAQVDSLRKDKERFAKSCDSLATRTGILKKNGKHFDLQQERLREMLTGFCDKLKALIAALPPSNIHSQAASVDFLKGELETRTVTESEALERIWQILKTLSDASQTMDVYAGAPPSQAFTGQTFFIRLGFAYLAAVQENGENGAIWVMDKNNPLGHWRAVEGEKQRLALWKAVQVNQRKIIPELVPLPFNHVISLDTIEISEAGH
jgi:hypothetical protein